MGDAMLSSILAKSKRHLNRFDALAAANVLYADIFMPVRRESSSNTMRW